MKVKLFTKLLILPVHCLTSLGNYCLAYILRWFNCINSLDNWNQLERSILRNADMFCSENADDETSMSLLEKLLCNWWSCWMLEWLWNVMLADSGHEKDTMSSSTREHQGTLTLTRMKLFISYNSIAHWAIYYKKS